MCSIFTPPPPPPSLFQAGTDADASKPPPPPPAIVAGVDARMLGALLTGVRRAVPFLAPGAAAGLAGRHADALFRVAGAAPLPTAVQALALLFQLLGTKDAARDARDAKEDAPAVSDRWYRALYARLGEAATPRTAKPAPLLSLVYRAAKADPSHAPGGGVSQAPAPVGGRHAVRRLRGRLPAPGVGGAQSAPGPVGHGDPARGGG